MKIIIACGGTGGHIFPGLSLYDALAKQRSDIDILLVLYNKMPPLSTVMKIINHAASQNIRRFLTCAGGASPAMLSLFGESTGAHQSPSSAANIAPRKAPHDARFIVSPTKLINSLVVKGMLPTPCGKAIPRKQS